MNLKNECSIREERKQRKLFRKINKVDNIIQFWNELDNVTCHKQKNTRIYRKIKQMIKALIDGSFTTEFPIAPEFIKKAHIENLNYKYSVSEIKEIMMSLSLLCGPGYSINKYDYTPKIKRLDYLLYNSACNSSYFLLVEANPPRLCVYKSIDLDNLPYDRDHLDGFLNMMNYGYRENKADIAETAIGIQKLIEFHSKHSFQNSTLDSLVNFLHIFKNYLREWYKEIKPFMIGNQTYIWQNFCKYLERHYHETIRNGI